MNRRSDCRWGGGEKIFKSVFMRVISMAAAAAAVVVSIIIMVMAIGDGV